MTTRPYLSARPRAWKNQDEPDLPGIGLFRGNRPQAHLTPTEAITLANRLVDLVEKLEKENS